MKSPAASTSSGDSAFSAPISRKRSALTNGSYATTRMPKARARIATSWPMRPKPSTPSVLPSTSVPPNFARSHLPQVRLACACGMLRASASISATVCSAAATVLASGALATMMPLLEAAATSTLSTPTPARPTTRRLSARSITSASSLVARADQDAVVAADALQQVVAAPVGAEVDVEALAQHVHAGLGDLLRDEDAERLGEGHAAAGDAGVRRTPSARRRRRRRARPRGRAGRAPSRRR